jgi:hypothetical protein
LRDSFLRNWQVNPKKGGMETWLHPARDGGDFGFFSALYAQRRRILHFTFRVSISVASAERPVSICRLCFSIFFRWPKPDFPVFFIAPS